MLKPECLNPKEVLAHLNSLGYQNITPQQLKEFLHDLKKLIKYEQKHISRGCPDCNESLNSRSSNSECSCSESDGRTIKSSNSESCDSSSISDCSSSATFKRHRNPNRNGIDVDLAEKAQSSFIRPWNIQSFRDVSSRSKKNRDPVRLYHQYKRLWSQQNIPGENKHSQLRWVIRNKMMGEEPNPRVVI